MMPQEFHVIQCYSCKVFQVDIIKKTPKWSCKMCGEKQSVKKVYSKGSAKECRIHVQELNEKRIKVDEQIPYECDSKNETQREQPSINHENSKWLEFMHNGETDEEIEDCLTISVTMPKSPKLIFENELNEEVLKKREKCTEKREGTQINNLNYKKFKSDSEKNTVTTVTPKNIFNSCSDDIDSFLEI